MGWQLGCRIIFLLSKIPFPNTVAHILYLPPESGHHLPLIPSSMKTSRELLHAAKEWARLDPNPETSSYVQNLVARVEVEGGDDIAFRELDSLFGSGRIQFGTAGLRGPMEPGPSGMNDLVVIQSAQGLARYIRDKNGGNTHPRAVVGYDHRSNSKFSRSISSKNFAMYTKLVFEHAGIECTLLDGFVPTPIVSYAVKSLDAAVGVMVTASHNPKQDNGYKVYWADGCQIRSPMDAGIANEIIKDENLVPWIDYGKQLQLQKLTVKFDGECFGLSDPTRTKYIEDAYFQSIIASGVTDSGSTGMNGATHDIIPQPQFAYTAMHGVGCPYARRSFQAFNLPPFLAVPSQEKPDPDFPTVPFPNPEEKGALDRAMAFAEENKCDVVLANDPDADRLGVAEFDKKSGEWTVFTGDQIGTLLGHWLWDTIGKTSDKPVAMCASTVSSKMLAAMAHREGFHFEETLTGFKWIGSRLLTLQSQGFRVLFGYEEAIGFSCGGIIPDKDGISALGIIAKMASWLYSRGETVSIYLRKIHDKYGEFCSHNGYYRCNDPAIVSRILKQMRNGGEYFDRVGTYDVESIRDLGSPGYDSTTDDKRPTLPTSASSPMITFRFVNGCVAQFRASGTEPKFKYYIELRGKPGEMRSDVEMRLTEMSRIILEELLRPSENGLILPSNL